MVKEEKINLIKSNYRKSVSREEFVRWVNDAWDSIYTDSIINYSLINVKNGLQELEDEIIIE